MFPKGTEKNNDIAVVYIIYTYRASGLALSQL